MNWKKKKTRLVTSHILFWSMLWLFYVFFFSYNSNINLLVFTFSTFLIPITAIPTYLTVIVLIPKYLNSKKYKWFGIYSFSTFLFTTFCVLLLLMLSVAYSGSITFEDLPLMGRNYAYLTILIYLIVVLTSFLSVWRMSVKIDRKNNVLQNLLLTSKVKSKEQELSCLKTQIHPHFLFNTLNTIYGLALKKDSETPTTILNLSNLLDYILYQTNKPTVMLTDEILHLEQYIELEKIRFKDTLKVIYSKQIENLEVGIAPLVLMPFVENVFKHGNTINGYLEVIIDISVTDTVMDFNIKNTFKQKKSTGGFGLNNIKERLDILYPENYDLLIDSSSNWFEVRLKINHLKLKTYGSN